MNNIGTIIATAVITSAALFSTAIVAGYFGLRWLIMGDEQDRAEIEARLRG